jgi:hypothetical protein
MNLRSAVLYDGRGHGSTNSQRIGDTNFILSCKIFMRQDTKFLGGVPCHSKMVILQVTMEYWLIITPLKCRRSDLTKNAERASVEVFSGNLKQLLLAPPVRGKTVLGVDPGFRHGCKWCVLSPTGAILELGVSAFTEQRGRGARDRQRETARLAACMKRHR